MPLTTVTVHAGACGFVTRIKATKIDKRSVRIEIDSECEMVQEFGQLLEDNGALGLKGFLSTDMRDNPVFLSAAASIQHSACPVAVAAIKASEVELGLNVPSEVTITFDKGSNK